MNYELMLKRKPS